MKWFESKRKTRLTGRPRSPRKPINLLKEAVREGAEHEMDSMSQSDSHEGLACCEKTRLQTFLNKRATCQKAFEYASDGLKLKPERRAIEDQSKPKASRSRENETFDE